MAKNMSLESVDRGATMIDVASSREVQEVQAAVIVAQRFPRDRVKVVENIKTACTRPRLAQTALYSYSKGGSDVSGPSIRLAETIAQEWRNFDFGYRELEQTDEYTVVQTFAVDYERNTRSTRTFHVPHQRKAHGKIVQLTDPREIYELVANMASRRIRACILNIIPGDVVEEATAQCEKTLAISWAPTPERIASCLAAFVELGVTRQQIEKKIQRNIDSVTPALLVNLSKIHNSIRDAMSVASDWFDPDTTPSAMASALKDKPAKTEPAEEPVGEAVVETVVETNMFEAAPPKPEPKAAVPAINIKEVLDERLGAMGDAAPTNEQIVNYLRDRMNWISGDDIDELSAARKAQIANRLDSFIAKAVKYATENGATNADAK